MVQARELDARPVDEGESAHALIGVATTAGVLKADGIIFIEFALDLQRKETCMTKPEAFTIYRSRTCSKLEASSAEKAHKIGKVGSYLSD